ncbi:HpcH/HpaI aldolase/citrate lyase family protein [Nocardioides sp. LHG3406-4]|uniref:HpcH/HpaI aldolase/citrate lyase family protein n=1 Tax=Nocardioides sp. LHG3406-4 TaxID=2804575 RepID=UPI003CEE9C02
MTLTEAAHAAATLLFVPGDRPERFEKAASSGADLVVVDLEDAVAPPNKAAARTAASASVGRTGAVRAVRINASDSDEYDDDVAALAGVECVVVVPKAEDPDALREAGRRLGPVATLVALVETATGILRAPEIAAVEEVHRLAFGSFDLAAQLGVSPDDRTALLSARSALVLASAAAGLPGPVDGVTGDVADEALLADDVAYAARLGFGAKLCIHPRQVPLVRAAFRPTDDDVSWARSIVEAAGDGGVALVDGRMVDKPVVDRARRILAAADG